MTDVLLRQPNYTCTETVERTHQEGGNREHVDDTLRLEVALVDGKELFAWPGSKQFEDRDLSDLVTTGMFGNGNFAIYARILFLTHAAVFEDRGETLLAGKPARHYGFRVPRATSGHLLRVNKRQAQVGFHGSFYADPANADLRRIEVIAEEIPSDLELVAAETTVDYGRVEIGDGEFLLPVESRLMMERPNHVVDRNWVRFAACRRFTGESKLSFTDPILTESPAPASPVEVVIPAGLTLQLEIPDLDLTRGAVGDAVRAVTMGDLRSGGRLLAPKGSLASGRIVQLDRRSSGFALRIEFKDLDWPGGHAALKLAFDRTPFPTRAIRQDPGSETLVVQRQAGPLLRGILMFWRTER